MNPNGYEVPVIEPRALYLLFGNIEPERAHEMQFAPRHRAGARNVARVLRDFRLDQYDMKHTLFVPRSAKNASTLCVFLLLYTI